MNTPRRTKTSAATWLVVALTIAAWIAAVGHLVALLGHLRGRTVTEMLTHGIYFFDADNFTPDARPLQSRLVLCFGAFMFGVLATLVAVTLDRARAEHHDG